MFVGQKITAGLQQIRQRFETRFHQFGRGGQRLHRGHDGRGHGGRDFCARLYLAPVNNDFQSQTVQFHQGDRGSFFLFRGIRSIHGGHFVARLLKFRQQGRHDVLVLEKGQRGHQFFQERDAGGFDFLATFFSFAVLGSQHGQRVVTNEGVLWVGEGGTVLQLPHQCFGTVSNEVGVEMATVFDGFVLVWGGEWGEWGMSELCRREVRGCKHGATTSVEQ